MKAFKWIFIIIPLTVIILFVSVANRHFVTFSLDPTGSNIPYTNISAPLFIMLFAAVILGVFLGYIVCWLRLHKIKKTEQKKASVKKTSLKEQIKEMQKASEPPTTPALPAP